MARIIFLGTASAIADDIHPNSHLLVVESGHTILVDCPENPFPLVKHSGLNAMNITDLVLTHFHPDHVSGVPIFLMNLWLRGRTEPLYIYGLTETVEKTEKMMQLYEWKRWPRFFPVIFHRIQPEEMQLIKQSPAIRIYASPVKHLIPTIGIRVDFLRLEKSIVYSSDTEPCPQVVQLAQGADILIHEATGAKQGHSSASQAAQIARQAGVKILYLIHYPIQEGNPQKMIEDAREIFPGMVVLAEENKSMDFD